jgi:hypothetical protein
MLNLCEGLRLTFGDFESRFRKSDESVMAGVYTFPDAPLGGMESKMAARLKKREQEFPTCHPIEWACSLLLDVCSVHPFFNGNGCLARLCFAYGLARHGIPFPVVFTDSHSKARSHYIPTTSLLCKGRRVKKESHQPKTFMQWELSVLLPSFAT